MITPRWDGGNYQGTEKPCPPALHSPCPWFNGEPSVVDNMAVSWVWKKAENVTEWWYEELVPTICPVTWAGAQQAALFCWWRARTPAHPLSRLARSRSRVGLPNFYIDTVKSTQYYKPTLQQVVLTRSWDTYPWIYPMKRPRPMTLNRRITKIPSVVYCLSTHHSIDVRIEEP